MSVSSRPFLRSRIVDRLRAAGCVFAEAEAQLLVEAARGRDDLEDMVLRRREGVPLEHILGWAEFCGQRIVVTPGVFVPRRRTQFLVEQAAALVPASGCVVDLCCGSGAVGAALARCVHVASLHAVDIDPAAVSCARRNIPVAQVHQGDLYQPLPECLRGRIDVLVANAPYVPTGSMALLPPEARIHEPRVALDGGTDGLELHRRVAAGAGSWLAPHGHLLIETSTRQAAQAASVLERHGFTPRVATCDQVGATVVVGARDATGVHPPRQGR